MAKFVNVYEVTKEYGGPEEGGWYFQARTPVVSVPCRRKRHACSTRRAMERLYLPQSTGAGVLLAADPGILDMPEPADPNDSTGLTFGSDYIVRVERGRFASTRTGARYE